MPKNSYTGKVLGHAARSREQMGISMPKTRRLRHAAPVMTRCSVLLASLSAVVMATIDRVAMAESAAIPIAVVAPPGAPMPRGFGRAIAIDGDVLVVGAPLETVDGIWQSGRVYVYERLDPTTWELVSVLSPPLPLFAARFGAAVSVRGDTIAVGEPGHWVGVLWNARGRAHTYQRNGKGGWQLDATLSDLACPQGSPLEFSPNFGAAVHLAPDALVVGAPGDFTTPACGNQAPVGRVFVYGRSDTPVDSPWFIRTTVLPPAQPLSTGFGSKISGDDARALVTWSPLPSGGSSVLVQSISLPDGITEGVGASVIPTPGSFVLADVSTSIAGSIAAIGDSAWFAGAGAVQTIQRDGAGQWSLSAPPISGSEEGALAGNAVNISEEGLLVGAPGLASPCAVASLQTGLVSAYKGGRAVLLKPVDGGWLPAGSLVAASDYGFNAMFEPPVDGLDGPCFPTLSIAGAMARSGPIVAIGAPQTDGGVERVWIFDPVSDCNGDGIVDSANIDSDWKDDCNGNGVLDSCEVLSGAETDVNRNGVLDSCERALGDLNLDGVVDGADLALLLGSWGTNGIGDLNDDGVVNGADLALLLGKWGAVNFPASCGNGIHNFGENCVNCPQDVQCRPQTQCSSVATPYSTAVPGCVHCTLIGGAPYGVPYYTYCQYSYYGVAAMYRLDLEEPLLMAGAFGVVVLAALRGRSGRCMDDAAGSPPA